MRVRLPGALVASLMLFGLRSPVAHANQASGAGVGAGGGDPVRSGGGGARDLDGSGGGGGRRRTPPARPSGPARAKPPGARRDPETGRPIPDPAPVSLSSKVTGVLDRAGLLEAILRIRAHMGTQSLPVFCYHSVGDPGPDYHLDPEVIDATPEQFDLQMSIIRRHFQPIGLDELVAHLDGHPLPPHPALVTFDDGYRNNLTHALPILERHGVPATFFLATAYVTERRLYWWDRICYLFRESRVDRAELGYPTPLTLDLEHDRAGSLRVVLSIIKNIYQLDLDRFLGELQRGLEVPFGPELDRRLAADVILTWDDVRHMQRRGMHFGSHTRTHRILHTLSTHEMEAELVGSRDDIRRELGVTPLALAYPGGLPIRPLKGVVRAIQNAGYRLGFTNIAGPNSLQPPDRFDIRRLTVDRDVSPALYRGMLALPSVFAARST